MYKELRKLRLVDMNWSILSLKEPNLNSVHVREVYKVQQYPYVLLSSREVIYTSLPAS